MPEPKPHQQEPSLRAQIMAEIRAAAATRTRPWLASDLMADVPSAETVADLSKVIYHMRTIGELEHAGRYDAHDHGRRGNPLLNGKHLYRLADSATPPAAEPSGGAAERTKRLAVVKKTTARPAGIAGRLLGGEDPHDPEACLDQLPPTAPTTTTAATAPAVPDAPSAPKPACTHDHAGDPIIRSIDRLAEPHRLHADRDAARLRALAMSPLLRTEPDLSAWLADLADSLTPSQQGAA